MCVNIKFLLVWYNIFYKKEGDNILSVEQLVEKMKNKGITFKYYDEDKAKEFLNNNNYYVKLTAYKTNFNKHDNKYVGLDFLALKDLSTIDMYLKQWVLSACLSVEHSLKVNILKDIQERNIDEFEIVKIILKNILELLTKLNTEGRLRMLKGY